jgi:hypothetical protein
LTRRFGVFDFGEPRQLAPNVFCSHSPFVCCMVCHTSSDEPELDYTMFSDEDDEEDDDYVW